MIPMVCRHRGLRMLVHVALVALAGALPRPQVRPPPAEALASPDAALVRGALRGTLLDGRRLRVAYSANRDGWSAAAFHRAVDGRGPAVVLARTTSGALVGGYNPKGWASLGGARPSLDAFLFTWPGGLAAQTAGVLGALGAAGARAGAAAPEVGVRLAELAPGLGGLSAAGGGVPEAALGALAAASALVLVRAGVAVGAGLLWRPLVLPKVSGAGLAALDDPSAGPAFGADAFVVPLARDAPRLARSRLGSAYALRPDGGRSLLSAGGGGGGARAGGGASRGTGRAQYADEAQLATLLVLVGVYARGEPVPNSAAVNDFTSG